MSRKTTEAYLAVFKFIEDNLLFKFEPAEFMTDYEDGMRLAIRKRWPNVPVRGCWFHFKRAVHKKCITFGMKQFLQKNVNARTLKTMLVNIPLLPANRIHEGYASIEKFARQKKLDGRFAAVFSYFKNYWLKQVGCLLQNKLIIFNSVICFRISHRMKETQSLLPI